MKKILFLITVLISVLLLASCTMLLPMMQHTCTDANGDTKCDTCGGYVAPAACTSHVDANNDGLCDKTGCGATVLMEMEDVVFKDMTKVYNGKPYTISVKGAPDDAEIEYSMENTQTNAGTYEITAYITADGYEDFEITATLKINPKPISIEWGENGPFPSNGKQPAIDYKLSGVIAGDDADVNLNFGKCDFTTEGTFEVTATAQNPNYTIKSAKGANKTEFIMGSNNHTVTFVSGVEGKDIEPETVPDGETVDSPGTFFNKGYTLLGWFNGETEWNFENPVTESITLTAKWRIEEYSINYYLCGGTNASDNPTKYTVETGINLSAPKKEGCIFLGWYEDSVYYNPLSATAPGEKVNNVNLYAKWATADYDEVVTGATLDDSFVLGEYLSGGKYRYTLTANLDTLGEDGVIYIGKGRETVDGSYLKITATEISVCTNTAEGTDTESHSHYRTLRGYIVVEIVTNKGKATVSVRTADGELNNNFGFAGKNGEIFAAAENVTLSDVSFAWSAVGYGESVWMLTDSETSYDNQDSWAKNLFDSGFLEANLISAKGADSTAVLAAFKSALNKAVPVYAVWSFAKESGADYDANLAAFIALCKENNITPILTTQLEAVDSQNKAKNEAVIASGERYIDFASLESYSGIYEGKYTELGRVSLYSKFLIDFPEIITPNTPLKSASAELLNAENSRLEVGNNKVKDGKFMVFSANIDGELAADQKIIFGHGYLSTYAAWIEVNGSQIISYSQGAKAESAPSTSAKKHELTIKNYITVIITSDREGVGNTITVVTDGGSFSRAWSGNPCNGKIEVIVEGAELTNAEAHWTCQKYDAPIWIFGASYFSLGDPARWPQYMYLDGLADEILIVGRGGLNTTGGLLELEDALKHGTPKYIIWGYGMNDGVDSENAIKQVTYNNHITFLEICKKNNIEPIFISSVNCTDNFHSYKIDYVANRLEDFANYDYRVASLPHAVNGYEPGSTWYDGMLSSDGIHPTKLGARSFYLELLCQFPELLIGADSVVKSAKSDTLSAGNTLKIEGTPEYIDGAEMAFTLTADFDGRLEGAIEIGNGKGVEGGSWVVITEDTIEVHRTIAGEDVIVKSAENEIPLKELLMLRIIVRNNTANIAFVSSGDDTPARSVLFSVEADWSYAGDVFVTSDTTKLNNVYFNFVTE